MIDRERTKRIIRQLRATQGKHAGDKLYAGATNISAMAGDCADEMRELLVEIDRLTAENEKLKSKWITATAELDGEEGYFDFSNLNFNGQIPEPPEDNKNE